MSRSRHSSKRGRGRSESLATGSSKRYNRTTFRIRFLRMTFLVRPPSLTHLGIVFLGAIPAIIGFGLTMSVYGGIFGTKDTVELSKYRQVAASSNSEKLAPEFVFRKILNINPLDTSVWKNYVSMLLESDRSDEAKAVLEYLTEESKLNDPELNVKFAELLLAQRPATSLAQAKSERLLRQAGEMNTGPVAVKARRQLALILISRGDRDEALSVLTPVMLESPVAGSEAVWIDWSTNGNLDKNAANRILQRLDRDLRAAGSSIPFELALAKARMLVVLNQEKEARNWLTIQPGISESDRQMVERELDEMLLIASIIESGESRIPAWSKLEVLLKRDADHPTWSSIAAKVWAGPVRPGTEPTRAWVQKQLDDDTAGLNLIKNATLEVALIYNQTGKTAEDCQVLRRLYRKLLNHEPDNVIALNNLAMLMYKYEPDHLAEALDYARKAERLSGGSIPVKDTVGQILARMGQIDEAQKVLETCVAQLPQEWNLHNTLAQIYERRGMVEQAQAHRLAMTKTQKPIDAANYEQIFQKPTTNSAK